MIHGDIAVNRFNVDETAPAIELLRAEQRTNRLLHLSIQTSGSCEHYYHFLLGYLLPLAAFLAQRNLVSEQVIMLRSCGPLDRILREIEVPSLLLCERGTFRAIKDRIAYSSWGQTEEIKGFDIGTVPEELFHYEIDRIRVGIDFVRLRLARAIALATSKVGAAWNERPRILLIERGEADPYYCSSLAEHGNAASQRRSIANHGLLTETLTANHSGFKNMQFETTSLAEQIAWFGLADIVVAQYGAALANIVWMRPGSQVIEIAPNTKNVSKTVFKKLAQACAISYARLGQEVDQFGPAPISAVADRVAAAAERMRKEHAFADEDTNRVIERRLAS